MRKFRRALRTSSAAVVLVGVVGLAACSTNQSGDSGQPPLAGETQLRAAMSALIGPDGPPGVVVVVENGDNKYELVDGKADVSTNQPMTGAATTRVASVSKAFSGAIILSLASQGKLALGTPIGELLPSIPRQWRAATMAQVLQHTSGIPDYIKDDRFLQEFIADPKMERTPQQLIGYVAKDPLEFTPGSQYSYSDTDNIVAGLIAERIVGKPYAEVLSTFVSNPMQLAQTTLPNTVDLPAGYIHGYEVNPPAIPEATAVPPKDISMLINPSLAWASGGMISTANDLNSFVRDLLGGKLFNPEVLTDPNGFVAGAGGPPGPGTNSSGLGIYRYETACGTVYGHTGNLPGYTTFVGTSANGRNSVVVAVNSQITPRANEQVFQRLLAVQNQAICSANGQASPSAATSTS